MKKNKKQINKSAHSAKTVLLKPEEKRKLKYLLALFTGLLGFVLYVNTSHHGYTVDDPTVTNRNTYVMEGLKGIPKILTTSYWHGYSSKKEANNYRPLTLVSIATEWEFFPHSPHVYHFTNVLLFAASCFLLFLTLVKMFDKNNFIIPFVIALLYTAHPIHTEVVANIKSRDEILVFLFSTACLFFLFDHVKKGGVWRLAASGVSYFLALLSKENAITFLAIIPVALYVFTQYPVKRVAVNTILFIAVLGGYLALRSWVLGNITGEGKLQSEGDEVGLDASSILNNTIMGATDFSSRLATGMNVLGRYVGKLIIPHPLAWDYSFKQIPLVTWGNTGATFSLLLYLFLGIYAFLKILKRDVIAFGIIFYLISLALVSNIFILIKSTMAERFLYMPSLGFCIAAGYFLVKVTRAETIKDNFSGIQTFFMNNLKIFLPVLIILSLYSYKTVSRNADWKDNYTLYKMDTKNSPLSARIHFMLGYEIVTAMADTIADPDRKNALLEEAIRHLGKALELFPLYPEAQKNIELAESKKNSDKLIADFNRRIQENPKDYQAWSDVGMFFAKSGQFKESVQYFKRAAELLPSAESYSNLGNAYAMDSVFTDAIDAYKKALEFNPSNKQVFINLGSTYGNLKDYDNSVAYFLKALALDPTDTQLNYFIGLSYQNKGDKEKAKYYFEKANVK